MYGHASSLLEQVHFDLFDNFEIPRSDLCVYTYLLSKKKRYTYRTVSVLQLTYLVPLLIL